MSIADQIRESLRSVSADDLQRLAEGMARIKFPSRFVEKFIIYRGRNEFSQTTKGWPDAFCRRIDGSIDAIEATRDGADWKGHLESDLEHLKDGQKLASFFFVGGYPQRPPAESDIDAWKARFVNEGIAADEVTILVGRNLVLELEEPQYARIRQQFLGISPEPSIFRLIGKGGAPDGAIGSFQPTEADFSNGLIEAPAMLAQVLKSLVDQKTCLVSGVGASGKTTLAELVARSVNYEVLPSWYVDLARLEQNQLSATRNEMVGLSGDGVLFVIDNVHLDVTIARDLVDHWRKYCLPSGGRLLLLGRETPNAKGADELGGAPITLRASFNDMRAIVNRLCLRRGLDTPCIDDELLSDWSEVFGGSREERTAVIDLIMFTAAVDARIEQISRGDLELRLEDWRDAARAKYLAPIASAGELSNLLRLASLAELEIGLSDEDLPSEVAGLSTSTGTFGLVTSGPIGLEGRKIYSMQHAHIGRLLAECARSFDIQSERLLAVQKNISVGLRVLAKERFSTGMVHTSVRDYIYEVIRSRSWKVLPSDIYEITKVGRFALSRKILEAHELDEHLVDTGLLDRALRKTRATPNVVAFVSMAQSFGLHRSLKLVDDQLATEGSALSRVLVRAYPSEICALCSKISSGEKVLGRIDLARWRRQQEMRAPEIANLTFAAIAVLRSMGREDLARCIAERALVDADPMRWTGSQVDHLSHILRLAKYPQPQSDDLVRKLSLIGWFDDVYLKISLGSLCGALMSLANHLPLEQRPYVRTKSLESRLYEYTKTQLPRKAEAAAKRICLLGSYAALGGVVRKEFVCWSFAGMQLEELLVQWQPKVQELVLGMYEFQFWFGVMALADLGVPQLDVKGTVIEAFLARLRSSALPTSTGEANKERLVKWLRLKGVGNPGESGSGLFSLSETR